MDAAAKQAGVSAFLYFYFVRLFLTLYALPILTGFIMQAFLGALAYKEARKKGATVGEARGALGVVSGVDVAAGGYPGAPAGEPLGEESVNADGYNSLTTGGTQGGLPWDPTRVPSVESEESADSR